MENKYIIGIDPGKKGGIAVWNCDTSSVECVITMPETHYDILSFLKEYSENSVCYLEKVGGMPGQGGAAMFNFGKGFGHLEMALLALGITTEEVVPQKWQKMYGLGGRKGAGGAKEWKIKLKEKAQQLFPKLWSSFPKKTKEFEMSVCDALLIMHYGVCEMRGK